MAKRSRGLNDYKRVAKEAAKAGRRTMPIYLDGEQYRIGDEVLEGLVRYARPAKPDEDDSVDAWRLVVVPRSGGVSIAVQPSLTRAVNRKKES